MFEVIAYKILNLLICFQLVVSQIIIDSIDPEPSNFPSAEKQTLVE